MTNEDAIRWLDNLKNDIGNPHYERLWTYSQAIDEICYLLEEQEEQIKNRDESLEKAREEIKWIRGMLKEQEPVKPKSKVRHGAYAQIQHFCGNCNSMLHGKPKYCSECGRSVKWE